MAKRYVNGVLVDTTPEYDARRLANIAEHRARQDEIKKGKYARDRIADLAGNIGDAASWDETVYQMLRALVEAVDTGNKAELNKIKAAVRAAEAAHPKP